MSENLPQPIQTDMSPDECRALAAYKEIGLPGISRVSDSDVYAWFNMYMSGKSYMEISTQFGAPIERVLMIADKYQWYKKKNDHLSNIHNTLAQRLHQTELESASFLSGYIQYIHRKLGKNIDRFLAGDIDASMGVTNKDLDKYFKAVDTLKKLTADNPPPATSPNGTTVINNGGTVNVGDPQGKPVKDVTPSRPLKSIAAEKRAARVAKEDKKTK